VTIRLGHPSAESSCVVQYSESTSMSLLQRARDNDQQAWRELVHLYGPLVYRWCQRSSLKEQDTADVFQETFQAVSAHLDSFSPSRSVGSFRSWLRSIVRTRIADHFRRLAGQPEGRGGSDAQMHLANVPDPLAEETDEEVGEENALVIQRAMDLIEPEFSEQNWAAFKLVTLQGHSATEVAERIGVNAQAVRQAIYRIRRRLRLVLRDLMEYSET